MSTTLYRFFDQAGHLLYVGISERPFDRLKQHRDDKAWWQLIARTEHVHFESRAAALAAEALAIRTEHPIFNLTGRSRPLAPEEVVLFGAPAIEKVIAVREYDGTYAVTVVLKKRWRP